jgi:hypothetical protein
MDQSFEEATVINNCRGGLDGKRDVRMSRTIEKRRKQTDSLGEAPARCRKPRSRLSDRRYQRLQETFDAVFLRTAKPQVAAIAAALLTSGAGGR